MDIGIGIPNQVRDVDGAIFPGWASQAEKAGFSSLATIGRIAYPGVMDTVALAVAAAATTNTIGLISCITVGPAYPAVLLAKELANIDAVSGGRLTFGVGLGGRTDDFVAEGRPRKGLGRRLDDDVRIYRDVWSGAKVGGGENPAVRQKTRQIPILFGGMADATYERVARLGDGYVAGARPASLAAPAFDAVRAAWRDAWRTGSPRLVGMSYFAFGDIDRGRGNVRDYYSDLGEDRADFVAGNIRHGADEIRAAVKAFEEIGADELILHPAIDDLVEIDRLAEVVL